MNERLKESDAYVVENTAPSQREEKTKPVAWMYDFPNPDNTLDLVSDWIAHDYEEVVRNNGVNVRPLYLQPREWQGLTMEELDALVEAQPRGWDVHAIGHVFALDVEQKLKEKNHER